MPLWLTLDSEKCERLTKILSVEPHHPLASAVASSSSFHIPDELFPRHWCAAPKTAHISLFQAERHLGGRGDKREAGGGRRRG
mgnify:CR=1 FL=1